MSAIPDTNDGDEILATWGQAVADYINDNTSIAAATGNIANTQTQIVGVTIPADSLIAGTTYRLQAFGVASNSSGADRALTLRVRIGTTTLTGNIATSVAPDIKSTASASGWGCEFLFTVRTAGASGTCIANGYRISGTSALADVTGVTSETSTVVVDTTVANVLELTAVTAHADATVNVTVAAISRLTP